METVLLAFHSFSKYVHACNGPGVVLESVDLAVNKNHSVAAFTEINSSERR